MSVRVYYPGVWDLLHVGHVNALLTASSYGTELIVSVACDQAVVEDKGSPPVINEYDRAAMVRSLRMVDHAIIRLELPFVTEISKVRPDILAIGTQWGNEQRHKDVINWCDRHNCMVVLIPYFDRESTTKIKQRITGRTYP